MTIRVTCAECQSVLKIKDELAGTKGRCPKCKTPFIVPSLETVAAPAEPATVAAPPSEELPSEVATATAPASDLSDELPVATSPIMRSASDSLLDDVDTDSVLVMSPGMEAPLPESPPSSPAKIKPPPLNIPAPPPADDDDDAPIQLRKPIANVDRVPESDHDLSAATPAPPPRKEKKPPARPRPDSDDEFDAAAFLSDDGPAPRRPVVPPPPSSSFDLAAPEERFALDPDDDDEPPRPVVASKPSKSAARNTGGASSVAAEALSDHAKAAKQMMRAIKESNARALEDKGDDEGRWQFDFVGMIRELGVKGLGGLAAVLVFAFLMYKASDYMMGGGLKLPELGQVTGTVLLDGQPLAGATVHFAPVDPETGGPPKQSVRTSIGITDDKGRYRMMYIDRTAGVAIGKSRVWISLLNDRGKSVIPGDYSEAALIMKDIKSRNDPIDFTMTSTTRR